MHLTCTCTCNCTPHPFHELIARAGTRVVSSVERRRVRCSRAARAPGRVELRPSVRRQDSSQSQLEHNPDCTERQGVRVAPCATPGWLDGLGSGAKLSVRPLTPLSLRDRARLLPASRQLLSTLSAQRLIPARRPPRVAANPPPRPSSLRGSTKGSLLSRALCVLDLAITCICELHSTLTREVTLFDSHPS